MQGMPAPLQPSVEMEVEDRTAPRFTLLIRAAKLVIEDQEYLCVVRDISATGASIRSFHPVPKGARLALEFQSGPRYAADLIWERDSEAGFQFHTAIEVDDILSGYTDHPRRDLRFALELPAKLHCAGRSLDVNMLNLSRQGSAIECAIALSIDQPVRIEAEGLPEIEARVRWRKDGRYGLVFHSTFSISNLALMIRNLNERTRMRGASKAVKTASDPRASAEFEKSGSPLSAENCAAR